MPLPASAAARKAVPIYSGCVRYFPHALAAVAQLSRIGNDQHNPGQPLHWAKEKSTDELDCLMRHMVDAVIDPQHRDADGVLAAVKMAWRALANLERLHDAGNDIFAVVQACELSSGASSGVSSGGSSAASCGETAAITKGASASAALSVAGVLSTP